MKIHFSCSAKRRIRKFAKRRPEITVLIDKQISRLFVNPRHPSLRLHKLEGFRVSTWSISIGPDLRMLFVYVAEGILVVDIGTHDEVYWKCLCLVDPMRELFYKQDMRFLKQF